jgi:hypothetical protein
MRTHNDDREGFHCGHCKKDFEGFAEFGCTVPDEDGELCESCLSEYEGAR